MQKLKVLTIDEQLEKFNNYRTQRNQAARNFKLRNKEKIENEWKKAYEINRNNPEFKERSKQRAKTYYELNRDAICLKAKAKNKIMLERRHVSSGLNGARRNQSISANGT